MKLWNDFFGNFKKYINYLMEVNFKELFVNTVILFCILVLSAFVYIPIGLISDLIRGFITIFISFGGVPSLLYSWGFSLLSAICAFMSFMYLFNKRFSDLEAFKTQVREKKEEVKEEKQSKNADELELPKAKDSK